MVELCSWGRIQDVWTGLHFPVTPVSTMRVLAGRSHTPSAAHTQAVLPAREAWHPVSSPDEKGRLADSTAMLPTKSGSGPSGFSHAKACCGVREGVEAALGPSHEVHSPSLGHHHLHVRCNMRTRSCVCTKYAPSTDN